MERIRELEGRVRHHDWGSRHALARLQGRPLPTPEPEAELWFGAHPTAPSRLRTDSGWVPLPEWIARDSERCLGAGVARRFGGSFPFLAKILAVEQPLSLQVHPDAAQAREGFERECQAGVPLDDPRRCYRDRNAKPELVCALTRFSALAGFRRPERIAALLGAFGLLDRIEGAGALCSRPGPEALESVWRGLSMLKAGARRALVRAAAEAASGHAGGDPVTRRVADLARSFPADVAVLAPLFLEHVVLEPGDALFLSPGEVHCYLKGVALEVMANSDNVLRAGLTSKHVDAKELLRVARFSSEPCVRPARLALSPGRTRLATDVAEFELDEVCVGRGVRVDGQARRGVEVLLCVAGSVRVLENGRSEGLALSPGHAAFVPAAAEGYSLEGEGHLYRVGVPEESR